MLSTKQAAAMLGVSEQRVRAMLAAGQLVGHKTGRAWLVAEHSIKRRLAHPHNPGRPKHQTEIQRVMPDVEAAHRIYDEAQEVLFGCCNAEFLNQARSADEQEFWIRVSDILLQQKQRELIEQGVF